MMHTGEMRVNKKLRTNDRLRAATSPYLESCMEAGEAITITITVEFEAVILEFRAAKFESEQPFVSVAA